MQLLKTDRNECRSCTFSIKDEVGDTVCYALSQHSPKKYCPFHKSDAKMKEELYMCYNCDGNKFYNKSFNDYMNNLNDALETTFFDKYKEF